MTVPAPADYPGCPVTVTEAVARGEDLRPPRWGLWDVTWAGIATIVLALVAGTLLALLDAPIGAQVLVVLTVPWLAMGGWPLLVTRLRGNGPRLDLGLRLTWGDVGWGALAGWVAIVLAAVAALVTTVFVPDLQSSAGEVATQLAESTGRLEMTLFALCVMVGGPVVEELYFRGLFFGALRKRGLGPVWTVVVTAVVFAGFHLEPTRFFVLLPSGLLLGWVRHKTGSTGAAMVAHGLINAPGAVVLLVGLPQVSP